MRLRIDNWVCFGLPLILLGQVSAAAEPDQWAAFRAAQRAEFATLPAPPDPPARPGQNPIDAILGAWRTAHAITPRPASSNAAVIRRLWLDTVGLPPPVEAVRAFDADSSPAQVAEITRKLLADQRGYAEHWMTFWSDVLRNDEQTSIDGLRKPITPWLFEALRENLPYDRMVHELLSPGRDGPDGYLKGVNWRGRVNLSQRPEVQAAQNISQVFLATSIRCASCHNGFTTPWKLRDAYGLAAFFSESRLEMARCDKPTGEFVPARFLYPDLGEVAADADLATRRAAVAGMVTRPRNERFARVIVNRLWAQLLGRGLAEPIDEMDKADCPELLAWLAHDFMKHDYDLKHTLTVILTSEVYRQTAERDFEAAKERAEGKTLDIVPHPRRLTAEQFEDAMATLTGYWRRPKDLFSLRLDGDQIRAWRQRKPDPLLMNLGRPTREQVVTRRVDSPTILQALEVTNGKTLAEHLGTGAATLLAGPWGRDANPEHALDTLFLRAFARPATPAERTLLVGMLGGPEDDQVDRKAGVEDVLWMIVTSPEFQVLD